MCLCKSVQFKSCLPLIVFTFPFFPFAVGLFIPFSSRLPLCLFFLSFYTSSMKLWRDTGGISIRLSGKFIYLSLPPSVHLYLTLYCCSLFKGFICVVICDFDWIGSSFFWMLNIWRYGLILQAQRYLLYFWCFGSTSVHWGRKLTVHVYYFTIIICIFT